MTAHPPRAPHAGVPATATTSGLSAGRASQAAAAAACVFAIAWPGAARANPAPAAVPAAQAAAERVDKARAQVRDNQAQLQAAQTSKVQACRQADQADDELLNAGRADLKLLARQTGAAAAARAECDAQEERVRQLEARRADTRRELRAASWALAGCDTNPQACGAKPGEKKEVLQAAAPKVYPSVAALKQLAEPAAGGAPVPTATALLEAAAQVQAQVVETRDKVADSYTLIDKAASQALTFAKDSSKSAADRQKVTAQAQAAFEDGIQARSLADRSQGLSNHVVRGAMELVACQTAGGDCAALQAQVAARAKSLEQWLSEAESKHEKVKLASFDIQAASKYEPGSADFVRAVALARTLDEFPGARSMFGEDAYELSASSAGAEASIKLSVDRLFGGGRGNTSLIVSAPTASQGRTQILRTADHLALTPSLQLSHTVAKGFGLNTSYTGLYALGVTARVGYDRRDYHEMADLKGLGGLAAFAATARSRVVVPWALGLQGAVGLPGFEALHLFKVQAQRSYQDRPATIACPLPVSGSPELFNCVSASFGEPQRKLSRVFGYEFRTSAWSRPVALQVNHNDKTHVTDVSLPIYLVANTDKKRAFNAGLQLGWTSTLRGYVGVFVGAPFSLYSLD